MKKRLVVCLLALSISLNSCHLDSMPQADVETASPSQSLEGIYTMPVETRQEDTQVPLTPEIEFTEGMPVEPYQDVRELDLTDLNVDLDYLLLETLWFNESNLWTPQAGDMAQDILERAKNPGLGIRKLHEQGITGQGINVAIIDQNMVLDHPEFQGKITKYFDVGTNIPSNQGSMHGPAVTSLLVGENIGTAPGARVYYAAAPSWTADAQFYADALNWIIAENEKLPEGEKIRVVSVSASPSGPGTPFTSNTGAWDVAYQRATEAGILVLDCTDDHSIAAPGYYDLHDPDNPAKFTLGWPGVDTVQMPDRIYIPTSHRTTAEEYFLGDFSYQYTGRGGLSWSIPYVAGVLALGWQLRPELSGSQLVELLFRSAYLTQDNLKIIDPGAFIEMVKLAGTP
jgi:subtilisin family serine protease